MNWAFEKNLAKVSSEKWSASVDPNHPERAAKISALNSDAAWNVFGVTPEPKRTLAVEETYARGNDLIAQFAQSEDDDFTFHLYWRTLPLSETQQFGLELWLGVQTGLLESTPKLDVTCTAPDGAAWQTLSHQELCDEPNALSPPRGPAGLVSKSSTSTGVWLVEPSDQIHTTQLKTDSQAEAGLQTFGHFMEKGVIRRGRMRFLILDADAGLAQYQAAYAEFSASELPLTT